MAGVGFIGSGMMAEAIISGMVKGGFEPGEIWGADPEVGRREHMQAAYGIQVTERNEELAAQCEVLVMAVKPQYFQNAVRALRPALKPEHRIISIMAGVTTQQLEHDLRCFEDGQVLVLPVVRVMPNSPAMVNAGITCLCVGSTARQEDVDFARRVFQTVGTVMDVEESLIDAATGVAGCGPAYVYMMIEAMADGGVMMGLPRQAAQRLAAEMVKGAAQMVLAGYGHPGELKDKVCSPGGATIAGVYALEKSGLRGAMMEAVIAGAEKCKRI
ncbi:MAG: pyrroline-5-carboxylate reductase [Clostridiales bacterium]|nr:pyrroline-5-carboxylate reductase [Clostridiales bacterium]